MAFFHRVTGLVVLFCVVQLGSSLMCYQCSSKSDPPGGPDRCGAKTDFDTADNIAIDCNSPESVEPGTSCVKIISGVGDERQVFRRCASPAKTGTEDRCHEVTDMNVVECYCSQDACNGSGKLQPTFALITVAATFLAQKLI